MSDYELRTISGEPAEPVAHRSAFETAKGSECVVVSGGTQPSELEIDRITQRVSRTLSIGFKPRRRFRTGLREPDGRPRRTPHAALGPTKAVNEDTKRRPMYFDVFCRNAAREFVEFHMELDDERSQADLAASDEHERAPAMTRAD